MTTEQNLTYFQSKRAYLAQIVDKRERATLSAQRVKSTERFPMFESETDSTLYYACESSDDLIVTLTPAMGISDGVEMLEVYDSDYADSRNRVAMKDITDYSATPMVYGVTVQYEGIVVDKANTRFGVTAYKFGKVRLTSAYVQIARVTPLIAAYWRRGDGVPVMFEKSESGWQLETPERVTYDTLSGERRFIDLSELITFATTRIAGAQSRLANGADPFDKTLVEIPKSGVKPTHAHYGARGRYELNRAK